MIGRLRGTLVQARGDRLILDVAGVGYEIAVTARTVAELPAVGEEVVIHTHLHVREDDLSLFGFSTSDDRDMFRVLLGAQGVGPKVALGMLAAWPADGLRRIVALEDLGSLIQVPGIGKRTAQRIILDLKPRLADAEADVVDGESSAARLREALAGLGYQNAEIRRAQVAVDQSAPLPEQIRQALKELGR